VLTVAEIHHFTYGWFTPVAAVLVAFLGWLLGLACAVRASSATTDGRRRRWLLIASVAIGGAGVWLTQFMALLGFEVPASATRYDPLLTLASMALAVLAIGAGLFALGGASADRLAGVGLLAGLGMLGAHHAGIRGLRVAGDMTFDLGTLAVSAAIAVGATTGALWFVTRPRGWPAIAATAAAMAVATCGVQYAGLAAVRVRLAPEPVPLAGVSPFLLVVPITLICAVALIAMAMGALQAITEEEFDGASSGAHRPSGARRPTDEYRLSIAAPAFTPALTAAPAAPAAAIPVDAQSRGLPAAAVRRAAAITGRT
jgi:NO-binding membrane sensor protein with MHYT domain